jgi:hypothetical protein
MTRTNQMKLLIATPPTTAKSTSKMTSSQSSGTIPSFFGATLVARPDDVLTLAAGKPG